MNNNEDMIKNNNIGVDSNVNINNMVNSNDTGIPTNIPVSNNVSNNNAFTKTEESTYINPISNKEVKNETETKISDVNQDNISAPVRNIIRPKKKKLVISSEVSTAIIIVIILLAFVFFFPEITKFIKKIFLGIGA